MNKKHSLIVGGTRGIGRVLVKAMINDSSFVSVIGKHYPMESDLNIKNVRFWTVDLLNQKKLQEVLTDIINQNGKINNLIFSQRYKGKGDDWSGEIETSLTAIKNIIEYTKDKFDESNGSSIVIVSSIAGHFIADEQPLSYHVVKSALNQLARYYAVKLGPKGIKVNCVSPGIIFKEEGTEFYEKNKRLFDIYKQITPLGRLCIPEDISNVALFLCDSKSSFITGQNIVVDGGVSLQEHSSLSRNIMEV